MGKSVETPIPRTRTCVEDAALLKTHSHTSERLGYEADKEHQVKREIKWAYPKRRENVNGNYAMSVTWKGGGGAKTCKTGFPSKIRLPSNTNTIPINCGQVITGL